MQWMNVYNRASHGSIALRWICDFAMTAASAGVATRSAAVRFASILDQVRHFVHHRPDAVADTTNNPRSPRWPRSRSCWNLAKDSSIKCCARLWALERSRPDSSRIFSCVACIRASYPTFDPELSLFSLRFPIVSQ